MVLAKSQTSRPDLSLPKVRWLTQIFAKSQVSCRGLGRKLGGPTALWCKASRENGLNIGNPPWVWPKVIQETCPNFWVDAPIETKYLQQSYMRYSCKEEPTGNRFPQEFVPWALAHEKEFYLLLPHEVKLRVTQKMLRLVRKLRGQYWVCKICSLWGHRRFLY